MGIALSIVVISPETQSLPACIRRTFMKDIADRTIVQDHDFTQIWLHLAQILDVSPVAVCTVLPVVPRREVFTLELEPVDDGVCIFLDGGGEDY